MHIYNIELENLLLDTEELAIITSAVDKLSQQSFYYLSKRNKKFYYYKSCTKDQNDIALLSICLDDIFSKSMSKDFYWADLYIFSASEQEINQAFKQTFLEEDIDHEIWLSKA